MRILPVAVLLLALLVSRPSAAYAQPFERTQTEDWDMLADGSAIGIIKIWTSSRGSDDVRSRYTTYQSLYDRLDTTTRASFLENGRSVRALSIAVENYPNYGSPLIYEIRLTVGGFAQNRGDHFRLAYRWSVSPQGLFFYSYVAVTLRLPRSYSAIQKPMIIGGNSDTSVESGRETYVWTLDNARPGTYYAMGLDYAATRIAPQSGLEEAIRQPATGRPAPSLYEAIEPYLPLLYIAVPVVIGLVIWAIRERYGIELDYGGGYHDTGYGGGFGGEGSSSEEKESDERRGSGGGGIGGGDV